MFDIQFLNVTKLNIDSILSNLLRFKNVMILYGKFFIPLLILHHLLDIYLVDTFLSSY